MAKSRLPSVSDGAESSASKPFGVAVKNSKPTANGEHIVEVEVQGYLSREVYVKKLTRAQAKVLRDKLRQLQDSGAKTIDGRFVTNKTQVVKWMLEQEIDSNN